MEEKETDWNAEFRLLVEDRLLSEYVNSPKKKFKKDGYVPDYRDFSRKDFEFFVQGMRAGLVYHNDDSGLYSTTRKFKDKYEHRLGFFNAGSSSISPKPIHIAREAIVTIGMLWRLYNFYGWRDKTLLGVECGKRFEGDKAWPFDAAAHYNNNSDAEYIACEAKKDKKASNELIAKINSYHNKNIKISDLPEKEKPFFRKKYALVAGKVKYYLVCAPDEYSCLYNVNVYGEVLLTKIPDHAVDKCLQFPN